MANFIMVDGIFVPPPPTIAFTDHGTTNSGTYNFGTAAANRFIVAALTATMSGTTPGVSAVSIGGAGATRLVRSTPLGTSPNADSAEIWIAAVPTGTSGVITVTSSPSLTSLYLGVYALVIASGSAFSTANNNVFGYSDSINISVPTNGLVIGVNLAITPGSISWSGVSQDNLTNLTTNLWASSGHTGPIAATTLTVSTNISGGSTPSQALAVASWSP